MRVLTENLMLGDWVCASDGEMPTGPIQIEGITTEQIMSGGNVYRTDTVQGIALTDTRLEHNGFVRMVLNGRTFYVSPDEKHKNEVTIIEDDCQGMKTYWYATDMPIMPTVRLRHLSDLQHALRMDGKMLEVRP